MNEMPYRRPEGDPRADESPSSSDESPRIGGRSCLIARCSTTWGGSSRIPGSPVPLEIDRAALVSALPAAETGVGRLDAELEATVTGKLGKPTREGPTALVFRNGRVEGAAERIDLLEAILGGRAPDDFDGILPKDIDAFGALCEARAEAVAELLGEGLGSWRKSSVSSVRCTRCRTT